MTKKSKLVKDYRKYPENLKRKVAQDYLSGKFSYSVGAELYGLSDKSVVREFVKWYRKKGNMNLIMPKQMSIEDQQKQNSLQLRIDNLEKKLSMSHLKIESLETMVDIAERIYQIDIRKKLGTKQSVS